MSSCVAVTTRALAQLAVQERFASDLSSVAVPAQFAAPDKTLRMQLPIAIADLKAMISAAKTGSAQALVQATSTYVAEMEPTITDALDAIDPSVVHQR